MICYALSQIHTAILFSPSSFRDHEHTAHDKDAQEALVAAPDLNDPENQVALGFDLQDLAGSGTASDELRRLYNFMQQINQQYRCPADKLKYIGTDKKYFMDFSYPVCFDREKKFWDVSAEKGCLVYSFGIDNNWKFTDAMRDDFKCEVCTLLVSLVQISIC